MTGTDAARMVERLIRLELAAMMLGTFAGHDDDCVNNKISEGITPGECSCGYSKASREMAEALGAK